VFVGRRFHVTETEGPREYRLAAQVLFATLLVFSASGAVAQQHTTSDVVAASNNPLADLTGFNANEYYASGLYDSNDVTSVLNLQAVITGPFGGLFHLLRATLPVLTVPASLTSYASGTGDLVIQDAFKFSGERAKTEWGVGPLIVMPTATDDLLGAGKWQAGASFIIIRLLEGGSIVGGLLTWQTDFAGNKDRPGTNVGTFQPEIALALGTSGFYVSSSPIWTFDFENNRYLVPFSLGFGKVLELDKTIVNVTFEPQVTVYHKGEQQPSVQLFFGLTLQWRRGSKSPKSALIDMPRRSWLTR
jgi:hypothetical protein